MNIRNLRYDNQATYLLYFRRGSIKLNDLRKTCKTLFNTIVYWDFYRSNGKGPTRCFRCQAYGHGSKWCYLSIKCIICAEPHDFKQCPEFNIHKNKDETTNYSANFMECPARKQYIELQNSLKRKFHGSNKPPVKLSRNTNVTNHVNKTDNNYVRFTHSKLNSLNSSISYSDISKFNNVNNSNLFSANELINIFKDILTSLKNCESKEDQISVLAQITIKYIYND
ncbi:uncharacterized protein LOC129607328 [Condylostylus longicornis]|uniref:uncharacterized protein LOC129607328 n=1 Tax=Condylostylus longicornis TaxID=2530218 RepID=UPI00244DFA7E|nr:uncharacterized protein LOC129607328 [Condylostylus longicornis]